MHTKIRGDKKVLITPVSEEDLADIKIGDIVWLDGDLMTCRDVAHRRLVEYGRELPVRYQRQGNFPRRTDRPSRSRERKMIMKWFPSDRPPPCVWRNLSMNLRNSPV